MDQSPDLTPKPRRRKKAPAPSVRSDAPKGAPKDDNAELLMDVERNFEKQRELALQSSHSLGTVYESAYRGAVGLLSDGPQAILHHHALLFAVTQRLAREVVRLERELKALKVTVGL